MVMDGQARVSGQIYKDVEVNGKTYRLSQPNLVGIYGDVEAWVVSKKTDPLVLAVRACKIAPQEEHKTIWEAAMRAASAARIASAEELDLFWGSRWANAMLFLKALDPKHHEEVPDIEAAMKVIDGVNMDELLMNISVVNGEDDIKNLNGPSETRANQNQQTEIQSLEAGQESTSSLPSDTAGPQGK